jgi:hypothetical protein
VRIPVRGNAALYIAALVLLAPALFFPGYRWFLLVSVVFGCLVAGGLYLWHQRVPVKEDHVENKRPLGLD